MNSWLAFVAVILLGSLAAALWRVWRGPEDADRMMAAQLVGTAGMGLLLILWALGEKAALDVALVLALLAALAAVGFVKATSPDGAGDPEEESPDAATLGTTPDERTP